MRFRSVGHRGLRRLIEEDDDPAIRRDLTGRVRKVITALVLAEDIGSVLGPPGWRIHELKGERAGTWSISVSGNWRLTVRLRDGDIVDLDLEDYH